jgi:hypothetical protein
MRDRSDGKKYYIIQGLIMTLLLTENYLCSKGSLRNLAMIFYRFFEGVVVWILRILGEI